MHNPATTFEDPQPMFCFPPDCDNQSKAPEVSDSRHVFNTTNINMKGRAGRLKRDTVNYTGGGSLTVWGRGKEIDQRDMYP
jgi:hypothetical protein